MCLWELVTRRIPYDGVQSVRIITSVINGMRPQVRQGLGWGSYLAKRTFSVLFFQHTYVVAQTH